MATKDGRLVIVYDVDDVLNNLNDVVFNTLGINQHIQTRFKITENVDTLSPIDMERIISAYGDTKIFEQVQFLPGAKLIYDAEARGAIVRIRSSNVNQQIADLKMAKLLSEIPGATREKITMFVGHGVKKEIDPEADIIIEDSLENLLMYQRDKVRILIDKPYNKYYSYRVNNSIERISRVPSLMSAVTSVNIAALY